MHACARGGSLEHLERVPPSPEPPRHRVVLLAELYRQCWHFSCTPLPKALCIDDQHGIVAGAGWEQEPETQLGRGEAALVLPTIAEQDGGGRGQAGANAGLEAAKY